MTDFSKKTTTTKGKLRSEHWVSERVSAEPKDGFLVGLCGGGHQLSRHLRLYKSWGYSEEQIVIVEIDSNTFKSLESWAKRLNFKGTLIQGCIIDVIHKYGNAISFIDADSTWTFGRESVSLVELQKRYNIRYLTETGTLRNIAPFGRVLLKTFGFRRTKHSSYNKWANTTSYNLNKLIPKVLESYADNNVEFMSYYGLAPMYTTFIELGE